MEQIIVAIIGGLCVAIPAVISTVVSNKNNKELIIYRIDELDHEVKKYNNLKDRMTVVEKDVATIKEDIKDIKSAK